MRVVVRQIVSGSIGERIRVEVAGENPALSTISECRYRIGVVTSNVPPNECNTPPDVKTDEGGDAGANPVSDFDFGQLWTLNPKADEGRVLPTNVICKTF